MLRDRAIEAFEQGDAVGFLVKASNTDSLDLVAHNRCAMLARGIYEEMLVQAFTATRTNNAGWPRGVLEFLFKLADRDKLRAAGEPLPGQGPFTLYRGMAGRPPHRHVRGFSWTSSIDVARWFADRFPHLPDRAVYEVTIEAEDVLTYSHEDGRKEHEFIVLLPRAVRPKLIERRTSEHRCA